MQPAANANPIRDAALQYLRMGEHPIPCNGKRPLVEWKDFQVTAPTEEQIETWWATWPDAGVALVLGRGKFAVDVDGEEGERALASAGIAFNPSTPKSLTGRGTHYILSGTSGDKVGLLPKVDIRGKGIIIVPPSVHQSGKTYRWATPLNGTPPQAPESLLTLLTPQNGHAPQPLTSGWKEVDEHWSAQILRDGVGEGERDHVCTRLAGYLIGQGLALPAVQAILTDWGMKCRPQFPRHEVLKCVASIHHREASASEDPMIPFQSLERSPDPEPLERAYQAFLELVSQHPPRDKHGWATLESNALRILESKRVGKGARARVQAILSDAKDIAQRAALELASQSDGLQGAKIEFESLEPWPDSVSGPELFSEMSQVLRRYMVMSQAASDAVCAWSVLTYLENQEWVRTLPILAIQAATKRSGKTRLMELILYLAAKPLAASGVSGSALFRTIEHYRPTFIIDEADAFLKENEELRGILNSGHTRPMAFIIRSVGDDHEPRKFSTWCPKAIAGIGRLQETLEDRSIEVRLKRKTKAEKVARKLTRTPQLIDLQRKIIRWVDDHRAAAVAEPEIPSRLDDRAADNWEPLLTIAQLVGGEWPARLRSAAIELSGGREEETPQVTVLADIKRLFDQHAMADSLSTQAILEYLTQHKDCEERPWKTWKKGYPLDAMALARLLKPHGVTPKTIRESGVLFKGYLRASLADLWERYVTSVTAETPEDPPGDTSVCVSPKPSGGQKAVTDSKNALQTIESTNQKPVTGSVTGRGQNAPHDDTQHTEKITQKPVTGASVQKPVTPRNNPLQNGIQAPDAPKNDPPPGAIDL